MPELAIQRGEPPELPGEVLAPLTGESWGILDGTQPGVPSRFDGHFAAVIDAPVASKQDPVSGQITYYLPDAAIITVRELAQGVLLSLPLTAFTQINTGGGRPGIVHFA
jgi:hypothetical protein